MLMIHCNKLHVHVDVLEKLSLMLALSSITVSGRLILDIDTRFCIVDALMIYSYVVQEYEYLPFYCNSIYSLRES